MPLDRNCFALFVPPRSRSAKPVNKGVFPCFLGPRCFMFAQVSGCGVQKQCVGSVALERLLVLDAAG